MRRWRLSCHGGAIQIQKEQGTRGGVLSSMAMYRDMQGMSDWAARPESTIPATIDRRIRLLQARVRQRTA